MPFPSSSKKRLISPGGLLPKASVMAAAGLALARCSLGEIPLFNSKIDTQVNVVVNLGGTVPPRPPPTLSTPAYYVLVSGGFIESGAVAAREKALDAGAIARPLARALAAQHYLPANGKEPKPSVLLVVHWGYINPQIERDPAGTIFYNQADMMSLIGGRSLGNVTNVIDQKDLMLSAEENRYFVILSAYDFQDSQQKKKTLLWRAKLSAPSAGAEPGSLLPALIASGAPYFGRETKTPVAVNTQVIKQGRVEVGTAQVVPDATLKPSPSPVK